MWCFSHTKRAAKWLPSLTLLLLLYAALYLFSAGCGSSRGTIPLFGASPAASPGPVLGRGIVDGYLYRTASGALIPGNSATPPPGTVPAAGVTVTVAGTAVQATTDAAGFFRLADVAPGLRTLSITAPGAPAGGLPLTVIGDATVRVGDFPTTRAQAVERAKQALTAAGVTVAGAQILAPQQPLPAGVVIGSALSDAPSSPGVNTPPAVPTDGFTVPRPHWLIYADLAPNTRFQHATTFVLVDAETGDVSAVQNRQSYPQINGRLYYIDAPRNQNSPDLVQNPTRGIAATTRGATLSATHFVRQPTAREAALDVPCRTPDAAASRSAVTSRDHTIPPCQDPKLYSLVVLGDLRSDFGKDYENVQEMLNDGKMDGIGQSVVYPVSTPSEGIEDVPGRIKAAFDTICGVARPCDTVFIYATSHGSRGGYNYIYLGPKEDGVPAENLWKYFSFVYDLDYSKCRACHIVFMTDSCYSGTVIQSFRTQVEQNPGLYNGKKVFAASAASANQTALGDSGLFGSGLFSDGGYFTNAFLETIDATADANGGSISLSNLPGILSTATTLTISRGGGNSTEQPDGTFVAGQTPQTYERRLQPGETCGTPEPIPSSSPVTQPNRAPQLIRISNIFLPDLHSNAFQVDAEDADGDTLTYEWSWAGAATNCGLDRGPGAGGAKTHIFQHDGCSFAAESATRVTVIVRDGKGGQTQHTIGLREEGVFPLQ